MAAKRKKRMQKPKSVSIYFLLWSAFSAFALIIVLLFTFSQSLLIKQSYKTEVSKNLTTSGSSIRKELTFIGDGVDYSKYILYQSSRYDMGIYILNDEGVVIFPEGPNIEDFHHPDFSEKIKLLKAKLEGLEEGKAALYEDPCGEFVYGVQMKMTDDEAGTSEIVYLYVCKSLSLSEGLISQMTVRTVLMAIFVIVLSFTISGALSGMLSKPITEMTEKAKLLAKGDFSVDFQGKSYGSEMQLLAGTLNFARDEISKADQMQKELIANVSHDFKTPLTMIKAYASMIQEISGDNPEKRNKHTQVIIDESDRLTSLVNDVLDISKIRSGINSVVRQKFNLSEYLFEVLEKFAYLSETQGYVFVTDVESDLFTEADSIKIGEVLYNLIGNAVNYTGEDKIVTISLKQEGEWIRFSVRDTGKGIPPEEIGEIWDRYYRSSTTHKRPVKGTGLGLSIVKTILEIHDFRFGVESVVGQGSVFYVLFPSI